MAQSGYNPNNSTYSNMLGYLYSRPPSPPKDSLAEAAIHAVKKVGPRVYSLTNHTNKTLRFAVLGCQGDKSDEQTTVANLMNQFDDLDFLTFLGDNFYKRGPGSPDGPMFQTHFYEKYATKERKNLLGKPKFLAIGNHDGDYCRENLLYLLVGQEIEIQEAAHSYMPDNQFKTVEEKIKLYSNDTLDIKQLPEWNMPYFYYSLIIGNVQLFFINSNSYVKDYIALCKKGDQVDPTNQALWLKTEIEKAKKSGKRILLFQHNPLVTCGKRTNKPDTDLYLSNDDINFLKEIKLIPENTLSPGYDQILSAIYEKQELSSDQGLITFVAHDHAMGFRKQNQTIQVNSGAGGERKLQDRVSFADQKNQGCYIKRHGFVIVSCDKDDPKKIEFDFHTIDGKHLKFTDASSQPVRKKSNDNNVENLRDIILKACETYISFLNDQQTSDKYKGKFFDWAMGNWTHTLNDVDVVHEIMNYLNQPKLPNFTTTLIELYKLADRIYNKQSDHSLYKMINDQLSSTFTKNIEVLYKEAVATRYAYN